MYNWCSYNRTLHCHGQANVIDNVRVSLQLVWQMGKDCLVILESSIHDPSASAEDFATIPSKGSPLKEG